MNNVQMLVHKTWDVVAGSWRFRWWGLLAAWIVCLVGWGYVLSLPNIYQATARVYLDTQSVLRPLLQGMAINPDVESELALVRQALLSRPQIEKVARQTELDLTTRTPEAKERLISMLQREIHIQNAARVSGSTTDGVYSISFQYHNRVQVLAVVQHLLNTFVEDTLGNKRTGQADAERFLEEQITDYEQRLTAAENRRSEFKKQNVGRMPGAQGDYFQRLQTELAGLQTAEKTLALAQTRHDEMTRQIKGEEPFLFGFDNTPTVNNQSGDVTARIHDLEARLEELRLRYTDKHPEVIASQHTLDELRAQQAQELARVREGQATSGALSASLKSNPVYQSIQVQLMQTEVQLAELRQDVAQRQAHIAELRKLIDTIPEVEAELLRLDRDYAVTQTQFQQLAKRLETARLSKEADRTGTVNFQIIDPPMVAVDPVGPRRALLLIGVLLLGLVVFATVTYGMNLLQPTFQHAQGLAMITGLVVLGSISHASNATTVRAIRRNVLLFSCAASLLIATYTAVAIVGSMLASR